MSYIPDTVEKASIINEFNRMYNGECDDIWELMNDFIGCDTIGKLFDDMDDHAKWFIYPDEDGNPSESDYIDGFILDLFKWW